MNNKFLALSFCLFLLSFVVIGQSYDSTAWKYAKTINEKDIFRHLSTLASDEFEGRETGEEGQKKAMRYIANEFKTNRILDYGNNGYIQWYSLLEQENKGVSIQIDGDQFELNKDFLMQPSVVKNEIFDMEIVFVGYGIEEDNYDSYKNLNVKNKGVIFLNSTPKNVELKNKWGIKDKIALAKEKGASAVFYEDISIKAIVEKYTNYLKRPHVNLLSDGLNAANQFLTIRMNKNMTEQALKSGGVKYKRVKKKGIKEKDYFNESFTIYIDKPTKAVSGENVYAYIRGTEKQDEVVVISAHYDHLGKTDSTIYNGADDNASGTAALLEMAEAFKKAADDGFRPKRSIFLIAFSGEEKGLLGSRFYSDYPIIPLEKTVANLNVDMIGRYDDAHKNDSNYIYLIGADRLSNDLHEMSEKVNELYTNINLDYTYNAKGDPNRFYERSDHYNFAKHNIPVIFYFNGVHEDYHKPTDTIEKIDLKKTVHISRFIFLTAWHIANAEDRLKLNDDIK